MGKGGDQARQGKGDADSKSLLIAQKTADDEKIYTAEEVATHSNYESSKEKDSSWIVYQGKVYDISNFASRHPGGWELITTYQGQDATDVMKAFHPDLVLLEKYLKPLKKGSCPELLDTGKDPVMNDFNALTAKLREEGYFESNKWFYAALYLHIVALEVLAYYLVAYHNVHTWGPPVWAGSRSTVGWIGLAIISLITGVAVSQAAWLQHDAGHKSIFGKDGRGNFWSQQLTMGLLAGASTTWWKDRHSRHHAKTNIYKKDPDIRGRGVVLFDNLQFEDPTELIIKPIIPYQAFTFVFVAVPSVMTWVFVRPILWHIIKNRSYWDAIFMFSFYYRNYILYEPLLGHTGVLQLYFGMRFVTSIIFTWVTQISHIPRDIINDIAPSADFNWVQMQCRGTLNVKGGLFNDWFTGHLNYQIEHHLWPQMPRHNYHKVAPMVQELCAKHDVNYDVLPHLLAGCKDVVAKIHQTAQNFTEYEKNRKKEQQQLLSKSKKVD